MQAYMLRDTKTGLFYQRRRNWLTSPWVKAEDADIWTHEQGPRNAASSWRHSGEWNGSELEIVPVEVTIPERKVPDAQTL